MSGKEIAPCPWCGGPAGVEEAMYGCGYVVRCLDENCVGSDLFYHRTEDEALAAWGRRAPASLCALTERDGIPPDGFYVDSLELEGGCVVRIAAGEALWLGWGGGVADGRSAGADGAPGGLWDVFTRLYGPLKAGSEG